MREYLKTISKRPVVLIIGTRPEAIKLIPVYEALKKENISSFLCATGQHAEILDNVFALFGVQPHCNLEIMQPGQDLFYITQQVLEKTKKLFEQIEPPLVLVQGDTTSAMSAALSAFYLKIPVAHVEAGLRTGNIHAPFPEEMNRRVIATLASLHFAPTQFAASRLRAEGVQEDSIFCTGNTVVDALLEIQHKIESGKLVPSASLVETITGEHQKGHRIFLLTVHRRESFTGGVQNILSAIKTALQRYPNLHIIYPTHPNPIIQEVISEIGLDIIPNISLHSPIDYCDMVYLLSNVDAVITDSGGIQEEAVSLGKPVLVVRNETDRPEGLIKGSAVLVGSKKEDILKEIVKLMKKKAGNSVSNLIYGDGQASERIVQGIKGKLMSDIKLA